MMMMPDPRPREQMTPEESTFPNEQSVEEKIAALERENERLREALERIATSTEWTDVWMRHVAREALAGASDVPEEEQ
jgi:hypothetical protein